MTCPGCQKPVSEMTGQTIFDSRYTSDGAVRRRRKCSNCGHRWTTAEVIVCDRRTGNEKVNDRLIAKYADPELVTELLERFAEMERALDSFRRSLQSLTATCGHFDPNASVMDPSIPDADVVLVPMEEAA